MWHRGGDPLCHSVRADRVFARDEDLQDEDMQLSIDERASVSERPSISPLGAFNLEFKLEFTGCKEF